MGRQPFFQLLLSQQDPYLIARIFRYNDYFLQARAEKIRQHQSAVNQMQQVSLQLEATLGELREQRAALEKQQALLLTQRAERERALRALRNRFVNKADALKQLAQDRSQLARVIAAARATMSRLPAPKGNQDFAKLKGKLVWPLRGKLQNHFGAVRNGSLRWDGLMIASPIGTSVNVIHQGRVVFADWLSGLGLLMIVDHGGGYMSLYAQNEVLLKAVGEWVQSGDTIARSGNSGIEQTPGLYFEIRYQGTPIDPARSCQ